MGGFAAALWAGCSWASAESRNVPSLTLDTYRQAQALAWDLRDEQNRPIQDPALRDAMVQAELEASYTEAFQTNDPATAAALETLARTQGRSDWGPPAGMRARAGVKALARRLVKLQKPQRSAVKIDVASSSGPPESGGAPPEAASPLPLVLLC